MDRSAAERRRAFVAIGDRIYLAMLLRHGFVAKKDGETFRFRPLSAQLEETPRRLAACYRERRSAVIAAIFSRPSEAVRSFADAFRFKKGGSDG